MRGRERIMAVTDEQVAALRALLTGDVTENLRLAAEIRRDGRSAGYSALVNAAFFEAVDRRFGKASTPASIIEYISDVRSRSDEIAEKVDPASVSGSSARFSLARPPTTSTPERRQP